MYGAANSLAILIFYLANEPTASVPQKRRRTQAMEMKELMAEAMQRFASMENSDELESENSKLKAEIALKSEEIVQLRQKGQRID